MVKKAPEFVRLFLFSPTAFEVSLIAVSSPLIKSSNRQKIKLSKSEIAHIKRHLQFTSCWMSVISNDFFKKLKKGEFFSSYDFLKKFSNKTVHTGLTWRDHVNCRWRFMCAISDFDNSFFWQFDDLIKGDETAII